jgi:hypothetical protein
MVAFLAGLGTSRKILPKTGILKLDSICCCPAVAENMTKAQIISKTLGEMKPAPEPADYEIVIAELQRRLPHGTNYNRHNPK